MSAEDEDAEIDGGVGGELAEGPVEMAVIGAGGGDDADAAGGLLLNHVRNLRGTPESPVAAKAPGRTGWECNPEPAK